jgi:hypothetical protein
VNGKCLELLWSNWSEDSQVRNKPQSMRQYLPQGQEGMLDHMLHLCKNSNSVLATLISQDMYLGMEPEVVENSSS